MSFSRSAAVVALTLSAGCQFVFGIDEYEPGLASSSGGASSSSGGGGPGGAGGEGSRGGDGGGPSVGGSGTGGSCECGDGNGWHYVRFDEVTPAIDTPTSECNGEPRINLFGGAQVECSQCVSSPQGSSCAAPGLRCFDSGCGGTAHDENPGAGCDYFGLTSDHDNCVLKGPVGQPLCNAAMGGTASITAPVLAASFCGGCNYCVVEEADCIVNDGTVPSGECADLGFPVEYELNSTPDGSASCGPCGAPQGTCNGIEQPYSVGTLGCDFDLGNECDGPSLGGIFFGRYEVTTTCTSSQPMGTFQYAGPARTVCCKSDILGPLGIAPEP